MMLGGPLYDEMALKDSDTARLVMMNYKTEELPGLGLRGTSQVQ